MKSNTSCPSWSRKYSATVNPVRATRARAPGGSFICPYTSEHGVTTVGLGHVVDQFHDQDSLAHPGTAEETNLASLCVRGQQVDHLDASDENLLLHAHLLKGGRLSMDGLPLVGRDRAALINGVSNDVDDPAESLGSHGNHDWVPSVVDNVSSDQTLGTVHGDGADGVLSQVLGNLENELRLSVLHLQSIEDLRQAILELDVHHGADDGDLLTLGQRSSRGAHGELPLGHG